MVAEPVSTNLEVISKPPVQYTSEARQLKVQGDVVLRVTFLGSRPGGGAGVCAWTGPRTGRRGAPGGATDTFSSGHARRPAGGFDDNITITFQLA
jgi:hypothetical protein